MVDTAEGDDVTIDVKVGGGNPEKLPEVKFVKGKWNELNGPRFGFESKHPEFKAFDI